MAIYHLAANRLLIKTDSSSDRFKYSPGGIPSPRRYVAPDGYSDIPPRFSTRWPPTVPSTAPWWPCAASASSLPLIPGPRESTG